MKILFSNFFILSFLILTVRGDACDEGSHTCTEKEDCHGILSGFLCLCKNGYGLIGMRDHIDKKLWFCMALFLSNDILMKLFI